MNDKPNRTDLILRWVARIWSLPAILFAATEIIFPHGGDAPVPLIEWFTLGLMFAAVIGLVLAWRWEIAGGSFSIAAMLVSIILFYIARRTFFWEALLLWVSFIIAPAALFVFRGLRARKVLSETP